MKNSCNSCSSCSKFSLWVTLPFLALLAILFIANMTNVFGETAVTPLEGTGLIRTAIDPGFWFEWVAFHPDTDLFGDVRN